MSSFNLTYSVRKVFFDRAAVRNAVDRADRIALSRIGAFVRRRARTSLRRRKKTSSPGQPPSVHASGRDSLKTILFGYEASRHSVVVGPVKLNQASRTSSGRMTIPQLHEFGGTAQIEEERSRFTPPGMWFSRDRRRRARPGQRFRTRQAIYPARPFMGPALDAERTAGTMTAAWRATVSQ